MMAGFVLLGLSIVGMNASNNRVVGWSVLLFLAACCNILGMLGLL